MKVSKWMLKIAMYCDLVQESGYAWQKLNKQIAIGEVEREEWLEEIKRSWFILSSDNKVIFHGFSRWECVATEEAKRDGVTIVNASCLINYVLKGLEEKPEWGYREDI